METLSAVIDATKRGWKVKFARGEHGSLVIETEKIHDNKVYCSRQVYPPGHCEEDDAAYLAHEIRFNTDDRRLPLTEAEQFAAALIERKRLDPDAPDMIALSGW